MRLAISRHSEEQFIRLAPAGEIDLTTADELRQAILETVRRDDVTELVVDLDRVTFLDSTGITALIVGRAAAAGRDTKYRVINPRHRVQRTLKVTGVLDALTGP
jgi:anti-anti-sigma factor